MSWQCFTDLGTGRSYRSHEAATNSETNLSERVNALSDCDMEELTSAARRLDHRRMERRVLYRFVCTKHGGDSFGLERTTIDRFDVLQNGSKDTMCFNSRIVVVNFDAAALPSIAEPSETTIADLQYLLDELRQREAHSSELEALRRSLQEVCGRPIAFVFTYNDVSRGRIVDELSRGGYGFLETPVFSCMADFIRHIKNETDLYRAKLCTL